MHPVSSVPITRAAATISSSSLSSSTSGGIAGHKRKLNDMEALLGDGPMPTRSNWQSTTTTNTSGVSTANLSCREAQLIAQRKPMAAAEFMCTCLVNALRDGGIIISYHAVDEDASALPMIESPAVPKAPSPPPRPPPSTMVTSKSSTASNDNNNHGFGSSMVSILQQFNAAADVAAAQNQGSKNRTSNSPPRQNLHDDPDSIVTPMSSSPTPIPMAQPRRSPTLADRLLQVLERAQPPTRCRGPGTTLVGGSNDKQPSPTVCSSVVAGGDEASPESTSSSNSYQDDLPFELDEELRPDPSVAHLGPADHTTITPLHWASNLGHDDCVRYLLMAGWNVNLRDMCGYTPLHYAVRSGSVSAVRLLLRAGARPDSRNDLAMTPLHGAILDGALASARLLLTCGGKVDCRDINGQTALMFAAQSGRSPADAVQMLLDFNADANLVDMNGETALSCCYRLHRARPNSSAIKSKLAILLRASRPEAVRPLRWYATRDIVPEFAQLSHSITRLERLAALRVRQMLGPGFLPNLLEKCELPTVIKDLLLLKR